MAQSQGQRFTRTGCTGDSPGELGEVTTHDKLTGVDKGADGSQNTRLTTNVDTEYCEKNEVMEDSPTEDCKSDHVYFEEKLLPDIVDKFTDTTGPHHVDVDPKAGADDSVTVRTANPALARNPRASDVRAVASPRAKPKKNKCDVMKKACDALFYWTRRSQKKHLTTRSYTSWWH